MDDDRDETAGAGDGPGVREPGDTAPEPTAGPVGPSMEPTAGPVGPSMEPTAGPESAGSHGPPPIDPVPTPASGPSPPWSAQGQHAPADDPLPTAPTAPTALTPPVVQAGWPLPPGPPPPAPGPVSAESPPGLHTHATGAPRRWRGWIAVAAVSAVIGGAVGAAIATAVDGGSAASPTSEPEPSVGASNPGPALAGGASIPAIAQKVLPEVVSIDAKGPGTSNGGSGGLPFGLPFGGGSGSGGTVEDQGTGMLLAGGQVLTNNHVISGATAITVTVYNQTSALAATVIGADAHDDAALLQITDPPPDLHAITFGDSRDLQVGDALVAIGNALGLSAGTPTVTSGIVSALGRTVQAGDTGSGSTETLNNMIQTDAAINPGNSGGPLVDSSGDVVGMNTAVASSSGDNASAQNIGFAIPESSLQTLIPQLRQGGVHGSNAYLGVEIQDLTPQLRQAYAFTPTTGALVDSVVPGSPADHGGLKTGDVIVAYDGKPVTSAQDVTSDVRASKPGQQVRLTVWRGAHKRTLTVTLGTQPAT